MLIGFAAGLAISVVTATVGVSGAVFLLPVQLDVLRVPSPQVTPTSLVFNVIAVPSALVRYRRQGQLAGSLVRRLVLGTVPGMIPGAVWRVYVVSGAGRFRLLLAFAAVVAGGIYGIGGGSLLSPILVSTFLTSIVGVITYALLALIAPGRSLLIGRWVSIAVWAG